VFFDFWVFLGVQKNVFFVDFWCFLGYSKKRENWLFCNEKGGRKMGKHGFLYANFRHMEGVFWDIICENRHF